MRQDATANARRASIIDDSSAGNGTVSERSMDYRGLSYGNTDQIVHRNGDVIKHQIREEITYSFTYFMIGDCRSFHLGGGEFLWVAPKPIKLRMKPRVLVEIDISSIDRGRICSPVSP